MHNEIQVNTPLPVIQEELSNDTSNYNEEGNKGSSQSIKRLSIIIPAYNEEKTISLILDPINEVKLIRNIERETGYISSKQILVSIIDNFLALFDNHRAKIYNFPL